ncbi:uncharacterized protein LOC105689295 [Athalia rosae]|uniref:uncharacterized protein LOC105689295 n=1 Tax=Athalia rosae TaxID=37344 RepID=UPI0020341EAD|nr:uncharacterized protein LOC105689295 [Athalia rosae]
MEGPIRLLLMLGICGITAGVRAAVENERTSQSSESGKLVLAASSAYFQREKTANGLSNDAPSRLQRTSPSLQLAGSENFHQENTETERAFPSSRSNFPDEPIDMLTASKHVDQIEGNNIEGKPGDYYRSIVPTRIESAVYQSGEDQGAPRRLNLALEPRRQAFGPSNSNKHQQYYHHPQNMRSIFQQRQSRQETPRIYSEHAPPPVLQTALPGHGKRQANPDIQDIITGIVKLLNGNVNVAANTGRPLRPIQATRINNRGPPRISDVPPLPPDFDTPGMNPPPLPEQPYPFEKPPAIDRPSANQLPPERPVQRPFVNDVPDHMGPQGNNRPGFGGLWNRPQGPTGTRRPIPPYKPLPPQDKDQMGTGFDKYPEKVQEKPHFDLRPESVNITTVGLIGKPNPIDNQEKKESSTGTVSDSNKVSGAVVPQGESKPTNSKPESRPNYNNGVMKKPQKYQPPIKNEDFTPQNTLILGSDPLSYPIPNADGINNATDNENGTSKIPETPTSALKLSQDTVFIKPSKTVKEDKPSSGIKDNLSKGEASSTTPPKSPIFEKTLAVETSSSVQLIEPSPTIGEIQPTVVVLGNGKDDEKPPSIEFPKLEPSKAESTESKPDFTTPTERLPPFNQPSTNALDKPSPTSSSSKTSAPTNYYPYRPRPGIVLDDTLDYTGSQGLATHRPYSPPRYPQIGDIFDVTVSAIQGPGGGGGSGDSVRVSLNAGNGGDVIVTSAAEGQGFVSIDGKRTYLNLFDNTDPTGEPSSSTTLAQPQPTRTQSPPIIGTGYAVAQPDPPAVTTRPSPTSNPVRRPPYQRRPAQPPVRIDTCIVGDSSTCDGGQHEACATVQGVSACHCKPGYARLQHSLPCKKTVSIVVSMRVDKIYERKVVWDEGLGDKDSESYQKLAFEANRAVESAMSMTPFSDEYMGSSVNGIYQGDVSQGQGGVFVNTTLKLTYEPRTSRSSLAGELQKHLLGVIHRRNNNIGNSALYVDSPAGSVSNLQDLDECASSELNDCHSSAICTNTWGGFNCVCRSGFKDPHKTDPNESGRLCLSCPATHCNNRGLCSYIRGDEMHCACTGNYYGSQCEIDGEVLGVAIGASVAALIIIVLTLVCLVMWSRRWSKEQKTVGSPVYGYMQGGMPGTLPGTLARVGSVGTLASVKQGPPTGLPPYMWAHIADHMATANVYATEPMGSTRPSSAMFGYPTLSMHGTLPPVPLPRLQAPPRPRHRHQPEPDSSDSEPQDRDRADLIPQNGGFHVPRPKSRSSLANQSGIYYDVEYDQGDSQHLSKNNIPMSTYSMARPYYRT